MAKSPPPPGEERPPEQQGILLVDPVKHAQFLQNIQDWADPIIKDKKCKCGSSKWIYPTEIVSIFPNRGGNVIIGGPTYPFLILTCGGCGHTEFYNAVVAGFVKKVPAEEKPKP